MISVILPVLSLDILDLRDMNSLAIVDTSSYAVTPTTYSLQITAPGGQTINVPFTPGSVNIYKCSDFGITCGVSECCPLPDGIYDVIYTVQVVGQPNAVIEKTFIRVNQIKCSFQNAFCKIDMECNCLNEEQRSYKKQLDRVDLFISGAVAAANDCNNALAYRLYKKAETILNSLCCKFGLPTLSCNACSPCVIASNCSTCS